VRGKVLGVMFDSTDLSWRLPEKKISKAKNSVASALLNNSEGMAEISRQIEQYQSAVPIPKDFQVKH
jgi:hypothetical protein